MRGIAQAWMFFLLLLAPIAIMLCTLQIHKTKVRKTLKAQLLSVTDRSELTYFEFTEDQAQNELEWEHSKEFEYKGEMYDVVTSELCGDTLKMWCWWDHTETALNKRLLSLINSAPPTDAQKKHQSSVLSFCSLKYIAPQINTAFQFSFAPLNITFLSLQQMVLAGKTTALDHPPELTKA